LPIGGPLPGGVIRTGSTHGGSIVNLVRNLTSPAGVALDERRGKVYWTDLGDAANPSAVFAANLDGSDVRRLISGPSLSEIAGIAVDARHDKLYFTFINPLLDSLFAGGIARADLDGSTFEQVVGGLLQPRGIAIDADGSGIYWADPRGLAGAGNGAIAAADLDGQHLRTVLGGLDGPFGVALDLSEQNVYWTDMAAGKIQRTAMSGILPYFQDVVTGLTAPTAIAIVPEPASGALAAVGALLVAGARRRRPSRTTRAGVVMPLVPAVRLHRPAALGPVRRGVRLV
jgi:DNA-binding beta-propeller fold protein YncE